MDVRRSLYEAILISGGTTMFPGFPTRLLNDVNRDYKNKILKGKEGSGKVRINVLVIYIFNKIFYPKLFKKKLKINRIQLVVNIMYSLVLHF
jgi:actin-related protein